MRVTFGAWLYRYSGKPLRMMGNTVSRVSLGRKTMLKAIVITLIATSSALAFAQGDLPKRKSGLWEIKTQTDAKNPGPAGNTMHMCIDQNADQQWMQMGSGMSKDACSKQDYKVEKDRIVVSSVCKVGQSVATSRSVFTGKYDSAYRVESQSTYDPPMMGRKEMKAVIDAKWVSACKDGQRPGDMIMGNGMTMNINDMMKMKK